MSGMVHVETISPAVMLLEIDNPPMNPLGVEMRSEERRVGKECA